jgi:hypothetical protein
LGDFTTFQGKHTISNKVLLPQVLMELHPISPVKVKNLIKVYFNLQLSQARFRQQFTMAKFIKGGACKLQLSSMKFKLQEISPSRNIG